MAHQSLYRRYRPRRFSEVRGQEHVVRALQNAVRQGTEGHAYLFSGPRGTGKTSTARILAKALNCENLRDGEPCCECESCLAIEEGRSYDLFELDAASNNGVDAMRDLTGRAMVGSPGRTKVYILDEVHMLSPAASNALLKTLEEPPEHVRFVLATTDPQKVLPTIRSRTQHYDFHLLSAAELTEHVRWVAADADLELDEASVAHVVRQGAGSARDTLSALDQVVAAGGVLTSSLAVDRLLEALADADTGAALVAAADALDEGRDPRTVAEALVEEIRDAFLVSARAARAQLADVDAARAEDLATRMGSERLVRAMEVLGAALLDMRQAPQPRIPLEVALVRLTRPEADLTIGALAERLARLERAVAEGATASTPTTPTGSAAGSPGDAADVANVAPSGRPRGGERGPRGPGTRTPSVPQGASADAAAPPAARPALGAVRAGRASADGGASVESGASAAGGSAGLAPDGTDQDPAAHPPGAVGAPATAPGASDDLASDPSDQGPAAEPVRAVGDDGAVNSPAPRPPVVPAGAPPAGGASPVAPVGAHTGDAPPADGAGAPSGPTRDDLVLAFPAVIDSMKGMARALFAQGRFAAAAHGRAQFVLDNAPTVERAERFRPEVEAALARTMGASVTLELLTEADWAQRSASATPLGEPDPNPPPTDSAPPPVQPAGTASDGTASDGSASDDPTSDNPTSDGRPDDPTSDDPASDGTGTKPASESRQPDGTPEVDVGAAAPASGDPAAPRTRARIGTRRPPAGTGAESDDATEGSAPQRGGPGQKRTSALRERGPGQRSAPTQASASLGAGSPAPAGGRHDAGESGPNKGGRAPLGRTAPGVSEPDHGEAGHDEIDFAEVPHLPVADVRTGIDRLTQAFPGAKLVDGEP